MNIVCPICSRITPFHYQEDHHLVPKAKKGKEKVTMCCDCGDILHQLFTNNELKKYLNTLDKIKEDPKIISWIQWAQKRPAQFGFCMKRKKKR